MSKRKCKLYLLFFVIYALILFGWGLFIAYRRFDGFGETEIVYGQGNNYERVQYKPKIRWCQPLKFVQNTTGRPIIALVSFPGSGSTWLRYLLQQATGILTGSVYKDNDLPWNGLYGESVNNESFSVVKTQEWGPSTRDSFDKVVLLIRSPGPAILAEFNRRSGGHLGYAPIDRFTRNEGREWANFVTDKLETWRNMNLDWLRNFRKQMLVVYYEDLVREPNKIVETIIPFLGFKVDKNHLRCMMRRKEGIYRRRKPPLPFEPFTRELRIVLDSQWKIIHEEVMKWKLGS